MGFHEASLAQEEARLAAQDKDNACAESAARKFLDEHTFITVHDNLTDIKWSECGRAVVTLTVDVTVEEINGEWWPA